MRKILISFLLFIPSVLFAQKIKEDKVDDFTGSRSVVTESEKVGKNGTRLMAAALVSKEDGKSDTALVLYIFIQPQSVTTLSEDGTIYLKLNDESVVKFKNQGNTKILSSSDYGAAYFTLTETELLELAETKVSKIRVETSRENIDTELSEKEQLLLSNLLTLVRDRIKSPHKAI